MISKPLLQPQEVEVYYIIPALKRQLAHAMKTKGMKQKEIAALLHVETATISQYVHNKRGNKITFEEPLLTEINHSSHAITDHLTFIQEIQRLLRVVKHSGALCSIHKQLSPVPNQCSPGLINCFGGTDD